MRFTITMKDPDGAYNCIEDAAMAQVAGLEITDEEREAVLEIRTESIREAASKWLTHSEYVSIEIDTEAGTATVVEAM